MSERIDHTKLRTCQSIFGYKLCIGDEVGITAGRISYFGKIRYLTGVAIILQTGNSHKTVLIRVDKINTIMLMNANSEEESGDNGEMGSSSEQSS
jgi:hypothetical protein